jgi:hypothetical protein
MKTFWPWHYAGLEPLNKMREDWKRRAAAFQLAPWAEKTGDSVNLSVSSAQANPANELTLSPTLIRLS